MELAQRSFYIRRNLWIVLAAAPAIGLFAARLCKLLASWKGSQTILSIYRAPPRLHAENNENLPYPPNALPGSRDIETPFGVTRAYEFGPENGRKVLLVHGISTPCLSMAYLAKLLSMNGCRVCCYDIFGRGYSDAPNPSTHRQDFALFSSQIFSVITSSPLDWAGEGFTLVGYSLGGGISICFASYFPNLVKSLVLICPGGVIRPSRMTFTSQFLYGGFLPTAVVECLATLRMKLMGGEPQMRAPKTIGVTRTVSQETSDSTAVQVEWLDLLDGVKVCPDKAVAWQLDFHAGFVPSFVSSLRHGPIYDCHERLAIIGRRCEASCSGLKEGRVLVILGEQDSVILASDTIQDITKALGSSNSEFVVKKGGHDLPIVDAKGCMNAMMRFWGSVQ